MWWPPSLWAGPRAPLPITAFDGGPASAESLGRGGTYASHKGTPGSAVENPAALIDDMPANLYTSAYVGDSADVSSSRVDRSFALQGKVLQFVSVFSDRGSIFFEPLGRFDGRVEGGTASNFREIAFAADAIGFAGAQSLGKNGSFGLSVAYLYGSLATKTVEGGVATAAELDRGNGFRVNFGVRYLTGPAVWGLSVENAPGFLFWKHHRREMLPIRIRAGNSWHVQENLVFSLEGERRYYREGGADEDFVFTGFEYGAASMLTLRAGAFSSSLDDPDLRHYTAGATISSGAGIRISYAFDRFRIGDQKVYRSYLSVLFPFTVQDENE